MSLENRRLPLQSAAPLPLLSNKAAVSGYDTGRGVAAYVCTNQKLAKRHAAFQGSTLLQFDVLAHYEHEKNFGLKLLNENFRLNISTHCGYD